MQRMLPTRLRHFWICKKKKAPYSGANILKRNGERVWFTVVAAGADLRLVYGLPVVAMVSHYLTI
ncbi:hypothetical protein [Escherichia phage ZCEC13]|uniref:Uncharacterized protein n=1 Tax=Escherichia phage ZCEC13 TaxID=2935866 RepID=A0AAE9KSY0_9CAUD|nr:hypothetical protein [Escherichia phage ZCEC13]